MEMICSVEQSLGKLIITFESGWSVWLRQEDIPPFPLAAGTEVDREAFEKFILLRQYPKALDRAVRMLALRSYSRKEIECRLTSAHFDESVIKLVLFKLEKESLLDDRSFAEQWVYSRSGKYGPSRIYRELRMKGIDHETAESVLNTYSEEDQSKQAVTFAMKKIHSLQNSCEPFRMKQRVLSALVRRGYAWKVAADAYEEALLNIKKSE